MSNAIKAFTLCPKCNKESEIPLCRTNHEVNSNFHPCPHCGVRIDTWIRIPTDDIDLKAPVPELKETFPVVLYFGNDQDRSDFISIVQEAKPGLVARNL